MPRGRKWKNKPKKPRPCKSCGSKAARGHSLCEKCLAALRRYSRKRLKEHPEIRERAYKRGLEYRRELRIKILNKYGWSCSRCGFADERALQLDHIYGGGTKERKKTGGSANAVYRLALQDDMTDQYQILCANCNFIKRLEEGEGCFGRTIIRPPDITGCSNTIPNRQSSPIQGQDSCGGQPKGEQVLGVLVDGVSTSPGEATV